MREYLTYIISQTLQSCKFFHEILSVFFKTFFIGFRIFPAVQTVFSFLFYCSFSKSLVLCGVYLCVTFYVNRFTSQCMSNVNRFTCLFILCASVHIPKRTLRTAPCPVCFDVFFCLCRKSAVFPMIFEVFPCVFRRFML